MSEEDDKDEFFFRWQIKNFSSASMKTGEALSCPEFRVDILDETKWYLSIYPRGKKEDEFVDIELTRGDEDAGGVQIPIIFTIELEAADSSRQERRVSPKSIFERNTTCGFDQYIKRETLLEDMKSTYLPDDILTICCKLERAPSEVEYIREYIAETCFETVQTEVTWNIENWSTIWDFSKVYKDVEFTGHHRASFQMSICESTDDKESFVLKVKKIKAKKNIYLNCRISVLDTEESEAVVQTTSHCFIDASDTSSQKLFDLEDIKDSYLKDDTLSLRCVLNMETGKKLYKISEKVHEAPYDEDEDSDQYINRELVKDYENMFISGEFSNVKIRAGYKEVNCHKSILYARSQVIGDMLDKAEESQKDGDDCVIYIDDLDGDTLEQMIYFMYSDKIKNIKPASALKLFVAGHKYQIKYLKQKCSLYLSTAFNFENVYDILIAAHIYEDGKLKRHAIKYISEYFSRICLTTEWSNFRKAEKELAANVCLEIRRIKKI